MATTPKDKCEVCKKSLSDMDEGWTECPLCGSRICDLCFKEIEKRAR